MTALEHLHQSGLVEIFQTSTLPVEFQNWPLGKEKAAGYAVLGGSTTACLTPGNLDSLLGTPSHISLFLQIHNIAFGGIDTHHRINDLRDALHIDQANQNHTDFFVTNEKQLLAANASLRSIGVEVSICDADDCLSAILESFKRDYGTSQPSDLTEILADSGPIFLGSNSCGGTEFVDNISGESLLGFVRTDNGAALCATLRTSEGHLGLSIIPGVPLRFHVPALRIYGETGPSPFLVGNETCRSFSIVDQNEQAVMAARMLRNGRLMFYQLKLRNQLGEVVVALDRGELSVRDATIRPIA